MLKRFTLEAIVQLEVPRRSLITITITKSLDTNRIFSLMDLSVAFTNIDLKPHLIISAYQSILCSDFLQGILKGLIGIEK